jgi:predicted permease
MLVLLGDVLALLLIACANVANLVLVRSIGRVREFTLRAALGCTNGRMLRQLVTENLALAAVGGALGALVAWAAVRALVSALPPQIPRTATISVDGRVLGFAAVLTMVTGMAFGLLPAVRAAWSGSAPGAPGERSHSMTVGHGRIASALTVVQLALAVVMVATAGLLLRSFDELRHVDPGFAPARVLAAAVTLSPATYHEDQRTITFFESVLDRLRSQPGVVSVAAVNRPPLRAPVYGTAMRIEGQFEDFKHTLPTIEHEQTVTPAYFETMGIPIVHGRAFSVDDRAGTPPVAVVSASFARQFWPGGDAIGKHIGPPFPGSWITIVGVAAEVQQDSLSAERRVGRGLCAHRRGGTRPHGARERRAAHGVHCFRVIGACAIHRAAARRLCRARGCPGRGWRIRRRRIWRVATHARVWCASGSWCDARRTDAPGAGPRGSAGGNGDCGRPRRRVWCHAGTRRIALRREHD